MLQETNITKQIHRESTAEKKGLHYFESLLCAALTAVMHQINITQVHREDTAEKKGLHYFKSSFRAVLVTVVHLQRLFGVEGSTTQLTDKVALGRKVTCGMASQVVSLAAAEVAVLAGERLAAPVLSQVALQCLASAEMDQSMLNIIYF